MWHPHPAYGPLVHGQPPLVPANALGKRRRRCLPKLSNWFPTYATLSSTNFVGHLLWTCSSTQIDGNRWQSMAIDGNRWQSMAIDLQSMAIDGRLVNARTATKILLFGIFTESQNNLLLFFVLDKNITRNRRARQVCVLRYFFFQQENTISALPCYLLPKTNFLRFNLPPKTHEGDKSDVGQDILQGWR